MSPQLIELFIDSAVETLAMVGAASLATLLLGLPLGVLLVVTGRGGLVPAPSLNRVTGAVVNGFRSLPFIILLVALIPFTRLVAGTSIGTTAAIVPLRSEEHTSELQSLIRTSYAAFCLKKKHHKHIHSLKTHSIMWDLSLV